jgi:hypothetical protein
MWGPVPAKNKQIYKVVPWRLNLHTKEGREKKLDVGPGTRPGKTNFYNTNIVSRMSLQLA